MPLDPSKTTESQPHALQSRFEAAIARMNEIADSLPPEQRKELRKQILLADLAHIGLVPELVIA